MPYTGPGDDKLPDAVKQLPENKRAQWVEVWNSAFERCEREGGDNCEASAFAQANGVVMKEATLTEAATLKAKVQALARDIQSVLADRALPDGLRKEIQDVRTALRRTWSDLEADGQEGKGEGDGETKSDGEAPAEEPQEEVSKTVAGVSVPASSFLVVEDPDMPSTFHLQVKDENGKPDHRLMGGAYAALSPSGYRGNRYEGPNKVEALRKLKALYAAEEMAWPGEQAEAWRAAIEQVLDIINPMRVTLSEMFGEGDGEAQDEPAAPQVEQAEVAEATFAESADGIELLSEGTVPNDGQGPLTLRVKLIEPGFGNKKDGHYYSAEMLRRDAHVFDGAMMFETDHRDSEKSTRTWVSTVRKVIGFSETGAPIGEVVVHHPGFAQRVRNLAQEKMLDKLSCSILASGTVRRGKVGTQDARIVEAITDASAVDWVTRAGAGGQALAIMSEAQSGDAPRTEPEPENGGTAMVEEDKQEPAAEPEPVQEQLSETEATSILAEAQVNEAVKERLAKGTYTNADALKAAIVAEVEYLKRVTGSGKVTDLGEAAKPKQQTVTLAEVEERVRAVNQKWGFGPVRKIEKKEEVK